ncbi:MAG: 23S rRNA (uracil(1939)-C(5))-methyltransferase RlmD [Cyclobacteriaceae bacterium]|nr:23S rRNA (uracil(1939)-C(5))-methyltransferase RlmD [Cyclobacteriaceae bacterium]UYN86311.1 MAG: 23S rRNA (uracil(1939)-C(5))-methyltransferase RlmD [Cyclobacteriaceae bacterium]
MKKGTVLEGIYLESMAAEGKCVARIDGKVLFVEGGAPGDTVNVELNKIKSSFLEGKATQIVKASTLRVEPACSHFGFCGGCKWQHLSYESQLRFKQQQVTDNFKHIGGLGFPEVRPIIGSSKIYHYRNRLDFSASAQRWLTRDELNAGIPFGEPALGFHVPKSFDKVFDVAECHLQPEPSNSIRLAIREIALRENIPFFDLRKQTGYLRTVTIRTATTGEVMVIVQVAYNEPEWLGVIMNEVGNRFPQITSLLYVINNKRNDTFHDLSIHTWKGNSYITESMMKPNSSGALQFHVGPKSFYQTNSEQAYALYKVAWEMAELTGDELVYDLYTGTGTIANFVAGQAKKVIGLEYVEAAIEDANVNSSINGISNTEFYAGDMKDLLDDGFLQQHGKPDVVITDPPRAGMHEDVCKMLLKAEAKRIVYVSCNPATQARDLKILSEKYSILAVQPVDMFPHTMHVENVVSLALVKGH